MRAVLDGLGAIMVVLQGCAIYVQDGRVGVPQLHHDYDTCEPWDTSQFSHQRWLERAVYSSPWRVDRPEDADVVFLAGHDFARWCVAQSVVRNRAAELIHRGEAQQLKARQHVCGRDGAEPSIDPPRHYFYDGRREKFGGWRPSRLDPDHSPRPKAQVDEVSKVSVLRKVLDLSAHNTSLARRGHNASMARRVLVLGNAECPRNLPQRERSMQLEASRDDLVLLVVDGLPRRAMLRAPVSFAEVLMPYVISERDSAPRLEARKNSHTHSSAWTSELIAPKPETNAASRPTRTPEPNAANRLRAWTHEHTPDLVAPNGSSTTQWSARKLLFFVGHVPKLYLSATRYWLWQQLRNSEHATALSHTLMCSVGAYEVCADPRRVEREYSSFCSRACNISSACTPSAGALREQCRRGGYATLDWESELPDMHRGHLKRRLSRSEYRSLAMRHRFCLVAPGDWLTTPKLAETIAIAAAGGCLPVIVLPTLGHASAMLPYLGRYDYCKFAFVVLEQSVRRRRMGAVVEALLLVSHQQAGVMRREARRVAKAFVFRRGASTPREPSAAEYILDEACRAARRQQREQLVPSFGACLLG